MSKLRMKKEKKLKNEFCEIQQSSFSFFALNTFAAVTCLHQEHPNAAPAAENAIQMSM